MCQAAATVPRCVLPSSRLVKSVSSCDEPGWVQGPLQFAATSHQDDIGRHLGISGDSERQVQQAVEAAMESLAASSLGQGGATAGDQPPAFVAGKVAR